MICFYSIFEMASIFEEAPPPDAENIADESTLSIPDFISKRGGVKIDKDIENGQISARLVTT